MHLAKAAFFRLLDFYDRIHPPRHRQKMRQGQTISRRARLRRIQEKSYSPKRFRCPQAAAEPWAMACSNSSRLAGSSKAKTSLEVYQHLSLESVDKAYQDAVQSGGI